MRCYGVRCARCRSRGANEYKKKWNARHAEYRRKWQRAYNARNAKKIRAARLLKTYGITESDYETLLASQGGLCPIGGHPLVKPVVDHDHDTGKVRGILCALCNASIGGLDTEQKLLGAIEYLRKHARRSNVA